MPAELKKDWSLDPGAFRRLLNWLDEGVDSSGERYLEVRRRLVFYFVRKKCLSPDDLADETLTRIARRLEEEGTISDTPPARYCYIVARFVFLEYHRRNERTQMSLDALAGSGAAAPGLVSPPEPDDAVVRRAKRLDCLDRCLQKLIPDHRALIVEYYCGERRAKIEHRRELAGRLGVTMNAMTIRACRIRDRLETCVIACCGEK